MRPRLFQAAVLAATTTLAIQAHAQLPTISPIYNFTGGADGNNPTGALTGDSDGNIYGTAEYGGNVHGSCATQGCGTVFKLDRYGTLTTLYSFTDAADGEWPYNGVALIGTKLYGTAYSVTSGGVLFSMNKDGSNFQTIHIFRSSADGKFPTGKVVPAANFGLFGICEQGGTYNRGTLYYAEANGHFAKLHDFGEGSDGSGPTALVEDANGNLFGSTYPGGTYGYGTIFEYAPATRTYTILYNFQYSNDGAGPRLGAAGPDGTIYGTAEYGGTEGHGTLFALTPAGGTYTFSVLSPILSKFSGDQAITPPTLTATGALVGATYFGEIYQYQNGLYTDTYPKNIIPTSQLFAFPERPNVLIGTQYYGGNDTCPITGFCGLIFKAHQ